MVRELTQSKNGNFYLKNDRESNVEAVKKHYHKHKEERNPQIILNKIETLGNIPQIHSLELYPSLTMEEIIKRYDVWKSNNFMDYNKIHKVSKKMNNLQFRYKCKIEA